MSAIAAGSALYLAAVVSPSTAVTHQIVLYRSARWTTESVKVLASPAIVHEHAHPMRSRFSIVVQVNYHCEAAARRFRYPVARIDSRVTGYFEPLQNSVYLHAVHDEKLNRTFLARSISIMFSNSAYDITLTTLSSPVANFNPRRTVPSLIRLKCTPSQRSGVRSKL